MTDRLIPRNVIIKPMLAGKYDPEKQEYPVYVQPKYDGIRAIIKGGMAYSRTLKPIRNRHIQDKILDMGDLLNGLDGELIVGDPVAKDCYRKTCSGVMSEGGKPDFIYVVFDCWDCPDLPFKERIKSVRQRVYSTASDRFPIEVALTHHILMEWAMQAFYESCLGTGFEGVILRSPDGPYKYNRSTTNQGYLLKYKPFKDAEAVIIGFQEKMHNGNPAEEDERGYTKRSGHKEHLVPTGTLGAFKVTRLKADGLLSEAFNVGTGFDAAQREAYWKDKDTLVGKVIKFKYADIGDYDVPRFPVFLGFRDESDIS